MTPSYSLTTHSYICLDLQYCIFLDVRSDKYLAVGRQTIERLAPWLFGWSADAGSPPPEKVLPLDLADTVNDLLRRRVFTDLPQQGKAVRPQCIAHVTESMAEAIECPAFRSTLKLSASIVRSLVWARYRLSDQSLSSTIKAVAARRDPSRRSSAEPALSHVGSLIAAFNAWRPLYSRPNACMFDSLSLLHFLSQFNVFPSWVFGVISEPFQAHCWLQHGSFVLNDSLSHVTAYTPIMCV